MKVLILGTMTSPSGAPIAALRLASGLVERGHSVSAWFLYDREPIEGGDYPYSTLLAAPPRGVGDMARMVSRLFGVIRTERPDAVIGFLPLAMVMGTLAARLCGVPVRVVSHRVRVSTYSAAMRAADRVSAWLGNYTDVVCVSGSLVEGCAGYPGWLKRRIRVVYNGLRNFVRPALTKAEARAALGLPEDGQWMVAAGRLEEQKNLGVLIAAMAAVPAGTRLAIAGDGSEMGALTDRVRELGLEDRCRLLGALRRDQVPVLLAAGDAFVQPSRYEGQSNALLEALASGLPCLVSDIPEQVETVTLPDGRVAGSILPLDDADAWAAAIGNVPQARDVIAECSARFTYETMMFGFEAVLLGRLAGGA